MVNKNLPALPGRWGKGRKICVCVFAFQLLLAPNKPYVRVAYFEVVYSKPLQRLLLRSSGGL